MASVVLAGDTSGQVVLAAPAIAGSNTITVPAVTGDMVTTGDSATVTPTMLSQPLTQATAKAYNWNGATNNTVLDFTGIPSWAKRITVMFNGISTNGTSSILIQLGTSSGATTSGYLSYSVKLAGSSVSGGANFTTGFGIGGGIVATFVLSGSAQISNLTSNTWCANGLLAESSAQNGFPICGSVALASTLDRVRITTVNGTDQFDAGTVNIMYEG